MTNIKATTSVRQAAQTLSVLGQPIRIQILQAIGSGESCVCHLVARLGKRQAYISQHLMALRQAGILKSRREGKYVYYRLANESHLDLIRISGASVPVAEVPLADCACPSCET